MNTTTLVWYWQYEVEIWDDIDREETVRCGVVTGEKITDAMQTLYNYYGEDIINVHTLKALTDTVFEFKDVMENADFDYMISEKE